MGTQRNLGMAGIREAFIVTWRHGNGKNHTEAFQTEAGAKEFVRRREIKAHIYKGAVLDGLFPADAERGVLADNAALAATEADELTEGRK